MDKATSRIAITPATRKRLQEKLRGRETTDQLINRILDTLEAIGRGDKVPNP